MLIVRHAQLAALSIQSLRDFEAGLCARLQDSFGESCEKLGPDVTAAIVAACMAECKANGLFARADIARAVDGLFRHGDPLALGTAEALRGAIAEMQARELCSLLETAADADAR